VSLQFSRVTAICIGVFLAYLSVVSPVDAQTVADEYLKAQFLIQDGDRARKGGENTQAVEKYSFALKILRDIKLNHPNWNPGAVDDRIRFCEEYTKKDAGKVTPAETAPSSVPADSPVRPPEPAHPSPAATGMSTIPADSLERMATLESKLNQAFDELRGIRREKDDFESRLKRAEEELKSVGAAADQRVQILAQENALLKQKLSEINEKFKGVVVGAEDLSALKAKVSQLQVALEATRKENAQLRSIVEGLFQPDARRKATIDALAPELSELGARNEAIRHQLDMLLAPLETLSEEERQLLETQTAALRMTDDHSMKPASAAQSGAGASAPEPEASIKSARPSSIPSDKADSDSEVPMEEPAPVAATPAPLEAWPAAGSYTGRIALCSEQKFVIVDFDHGKVPPLHSKLGVYRDQRLVGSIRITAPVKPPFASADILTGALQRGDVVQ